MLIVGLGNPGAEYERTRHNIGFMAVRRVAKRRGIELKKERKFKGWAGRRGDLHLLLPATYMNDSGVAVGKYTRFYDLEPQDLVVVSDDAERPFGALRLRAGGGTGGHNGLKSVQAHLGTQDYPRLKVGIGRQVGELTGHVLGRFSKEEEEHLDKVLERAADALEALLERPIEDVMQIYNNSVEETR